MSRGSSAELCLDYDLDRPGCKPTILYRRIRTTRWDREFVHTCHPCDDIHEGQSWFTVLGQRFHIGLVTVTVARSLRRRLSRCLLNELHDPRVQGWELDELAKAAGLDAAAVLKRLAEFEARK